MKQLLQQAREADDGVILCCAECLLGCLESLAEYVSMGSIYSFLERTHSYRQIIYLTFIVPIHLELFSLTNGLLPMLGSMDILSLRLGKMC